MKTSSREQLLSFARGLAKAGGAALAANGINRDSIQQVVIGVAVALIGFLFSYFNHAKDTLTVGPVK